MKKIFLVIALFIVRCKSAPVGELYLPSDDVELLDIDNFRTIVENSTTGWLVEFYASWCGYCQRFAPHWKEFATEVASWRDMVRVGVVECSDASNIPICREFGIVKYPTVRYYHENFQSGGGDIGVVVPHGDEYSVWDIKKNVIETLMEEVSEGRGKFYPNLVPYTHPNTEGLFEGVSDNTRFAVLVVEPTGWYLGAEVALDLHRTPQIVVRHALENNSELIANLQVDKLPAVVVVDREGNRQVYTNHVGTRHEIKETLITYLETRDVKVVEVVPNKIQKTFNDSAPHSDERARKILRQHIKKMGDVIFQADLEAALRYSLEQEVGTAKVIKDEQLQTLQSYITIVKKYFPFGYNRTAFITKLSTVISGAKQIEGATIQRLVKEAEDNSTFSSPERFIGCLGSSSTWRGYPCSLWRLFHFLIVNSHQFNKPREVLDTMHAYVKNFFSCAHCSEHFQKMAAERNLTSVSSLEGSILWLWEAHNVVNARLKGDETEDPEYPKEQFPTQLRCPQCYDSDGSWKKDEVLKYLKKMYSRYNIRYIGSDTEILFPGLD